MKVELIQIGDELALEFTPEMRAYLGLEGDEVEVELTAQGIEISKPTNAKPFEVAVDSTLEKHDEALKKLSD